MANPNVKPPKEHQFKKGKSGNPHGAPRKLPAIDKLLAEVLGEEKNGLTLAEALLRKLSQTAMSSNNAQAIRAAELLLDRGYGKPKQSMEIDLTTNNITVSLPDELEE